MKRDVGRRRTWMIVRISLRRFWCIQRTNRCAAFPQPPARMSVAPSAPRSRKSKPMTISWAGSRSNRCGELSGASCKSRSRRPRCLERSHDLPQRPTTPARSGRRGSMVSRSAASGNKPRHAGLYYGIESDRRRDSVPNLLHGVFRQGRKLKVLLDAGGSN